MAADRPLGAGDLGARDGRRRRRGVRGGDLAVRQGSTVSVGRDADLRVGVEPPDLGISRRALTLTASAAEWHICIDNHAGAFVHPWAQAPIWAPAGTEVTQRWPKIGARLIGSDQSTEHWVLLESPDYPIPGYGSSQQPVAGPTHQPPVPKPLTRTQVEAGHRRLSAISVVAADEWSRAGPAGRGRSEIGNLGNSPNGSCVCRIARTHSDCPSRRASATPVTSVCLSGTVT
jgi:hypothetical protein